MLCIVHAVCKTLHILLKVVRARADRVRIGRVANPDRLTGLDASLPAPRDAAARTCTSARCSSSRATPPAYDELRRARSSARLHLVPRYRQKLAFVPLGQGAAGVGRRPALQRRATTCATPRCPRPAADERAAQPRRARVRPARWTAPSRCGRSGSSSALERRPLRDHLQDPPRARRRRLAASTSPPCCSNLARARAAAREPPAPWVAAARADRRRSCSADALRRARDGARPRPRAAPRGAARAPAPGAAARRGERARRASARWRWAGLQPARRRRPLNVPIGPHRRFAWVDADLGDVQGDQERARRHASTTSC